MTTNKQQFIVRRAMHTDIQGICNLYDSLPIDEQKVLAKLTPDSLRDTYVFHYIAVRKIDNLILGCIFYRVYTNKQESIDYVRKFGHKSQVPDLYDLHIDPLLVFKSFMIRKECRQISGMVSQIVECAMTDQLSLIKYPRVVFWYLTTTSAAPVLQPMYSYLMDKHYKNLIPCENLSIKTSDNSMELSSLGLPILGTGISRLSILTCKIKEPTIRSKL